ncbi:hypothetical protein IAT40_001156 [Kwoniella sp. CBS 6097]
MSSTRYRLGPDGFFPFGTAPPSSLKPSDTQRLTNNTVFTRAPARSTVRDTGKTGASRPQDSRYASNPHPPPSITNATRAPGHNYALDSSAYGTPPSVSNPAHRPHPFSRSALSEFPPHPASFNANSAAPSRMSAYSQAPAATGHPHCAHALPPSPPSTPSNEFVSDHQVVDGERSTAGCASLATFRTGANHSEPGPPTSSGQTQCWQPGQSTDGTVRHAIEYPLVPVTLSTYVGPEIRQPPRRFIVGDAQTERERWEVETFDPRIGSVNGPKCVTLKGAEMTRAPIGSLNQSCYEMVQRGREEETWLKLPRHDIVRSAAESAQYLYPEAPSNVRARTEERLGSAAYDGLHHGNVPEDYSDECDDGMTLNASNAVSTHQHNVTSAPPTARMPSNTADASLAPSHSHHQPPHLHHHLHHPHPPPSQPDRSPLHPGQENVPYPSQQPFTNFKGDDYDLTGRRDWTPVLPNDPTDDGSGWTRLMPTHPTRTESQRMMA